MRETLKNLSNMNLTIHTPTEPCPPLEIKEIKPISPKPSSQDPYT